MKQLIIQPGPHLAAKGGVWAVNLRGARPAAHLAAAGPKRGGGVALDKPKPKAFDDDDEEEEVTKAGALPVLCLVCSPSRPNASTANRCCRPIAASQVVVQAKKVEKEKPRQIDLMLERLKQ